MKPTLSKLISMMPYALLLAGGGYAGKCFQIGFWGLLAGATVCLYVKGLLALCAKFKRDNEADHDCWVLWLRRRTYTYGPDPATDEEARRLTAMLEPERVEGI